MPESRRVWEIPAIPQPAEPGDFANKLRDRIAAAIANRHLGTPPTYGDLAAAVIEVLGLKLQTEEIGVDCRDCKQFTLTRYVTDWEVADG